MGKNIIIFTKEVQSNDLSKDKIRIIIDGKNIKTKEEFLQVIEDNFKFPESCYGNLDAFLDYIRDLSWFDHDEIEIVLKNQKEFLNLNQQLKGILFRCLIEDILPYWEKDVLYQCVNGKCKEFTIYIVDDYFDAYQ